MADEQKTEKPSGGFTRDPKRMTAEDLKKRGSVIAMDGMPPDLKKALAERTKDK